MKWISIKDQLPEAWKLISFTDGIYIYQGWIEGGGKLWVNAFDERLIHNVTHWTNLIELPEQE